MRSKSGNPPVTAKEITNVTPTRNEISIRPQTAQNTDKFLILAHHQYRICTPLPAGKVMTSQTTAELRKDLKCGQITLTSVCIMTISVKLNLLTQNGVIQMLK